jgi:hypothetical protein
MDAWERPVYTADIDEKSGRAAAMFPGGRAS